MNLENNLKNIEFFRRYVIGARLGRGRSIPNRNIINFNVEKEPKIKILANLQGSGNSRYVINILEDQNSFKVIHDCPDFKKGTKFCKHIVKILLLIDTETCKKLCQNINTINFSSNFNLIKESKTESYLSKALDLISNSKYFEAVSYLEHAYKESNNFEYIKKASEIALQYNLYNQLIKYSIQFNDLINVYRNDYATIISAALSALNQLNFSNKVELITNIQTLIIQFPKDHLLKIITKSNIEKINNPILKFLLLRNLDSVLTLKDFFKAFKIDSFINLKRVIEQKTMNLAEESILNMEPEEEVDSMLKIANECKFSNYSELFTKIQEYKKSLKKIYLEALKLKHGYLRSLVIDNEKTERLRDMKFTEKYNYPSLIWTQPYKNESPLHYYIIEKCGFERHHLEYINKNDFVENYPVFKTIFNGNNPIPYAVKNFWGATEPKINNTVQNERLIELNLQVNVKELQDFFLIEWDLAQRPIMGSYICQFKDGYLIPDKNHPLANEIQPFDLILCDIKPVAIKGDNTKIYRPLRRINIKTAIELVWVGINFISSYLPLEIIKKLKMFEIDEFDAYNKINAAFSISFLPNKTRSQKIFQDFIHKKVLTELNKTYLKIINNSDYKPKVLKMIGYERYSRIFKVKTILQPFKTTNLKRNSLQEVKLDLKKFVTHKLTEVIEKKEFELIDIKVLRTFPVFRKWAVKVIYELKRQLEESEIYKVSKDSFDIQNLLNNYYGRIITNETLGDLSSNENTSGKVPYLISVEEYSKLIKSFKFLKLQTPKIKKKKSKL